MPAGHAYLSEHLVPSPLFGTCLCSKYWDEFTRTCRVFSRHLTLNNSRYFLCPETDKPSSQEAQIGIFRALQYVSRFRVVFFFGVLRHMQRYFSPICGLNKKLYLRSGSRRHRHFAGFLNVPVLHRHGTTLFIRWFRHIAPFSRLLRDAGDTEDVF